MWGEFINMFHGKMCLLMTSRTGYIFVVMFDIDACTHAQCRTRSVCNQTQLVQHDFVACDAICCDFARG